MSKTTDLIDEAGALASVISEALAAARANNPAVDGNPHVQAAHEAIGRLGLKVLAARTAATAPAESPQPYKPTTKIVDVNSGGGAPGPRERLLGLNQGEVYTRSGTGRYQCSWAIDSGGYPCYGSFDANDMGPAHTGGTPWIPSPDGAWVFYMRYDADPGRVQDGHFDMLPA